MGPASSFFADNNTLALALITLPSIGLYLVGHLTALLLLYALVGLGMLLALFIS